MAVLYKQQLEEAFYRIPADIRKKHIQSFVRAYKLKNENLQYEYLMSFNESLTINDVYREIRKNHTVSYSLYMGLMKFLEWLNFDIDENAELIWYAVKRIKNYYRTEFYSYRGFREVQVDRIKTAIWFID